MQRDAFENFNPEDFLQLAKELENNLANLEFYKSTQEALDRYDDSKKGMSVEKFLKELDSW